MITPPSVHLVAVIPSDGPVSTRELLAAIWEATSMQLAQHYGLSPIELAAGAGPEGRAELDRDARLVRCYLIGHDAQMAEQVLDPRVTLTRTEAAELTTLLEGYRSRAFLEGSTVFHDRLTAAIALLRREGGRSAEINTLLNALYKEDPSG